MSATSLSAYAAWLTKRESKAPKRRSLDAVEEIEGEAPKESASTEASTDPYMQWITRKESKLPAVKVVMVTPDAIAEIVQRGRAAAAKAQANQTGGLGSHHKSATDKAASSQVVNKKGKKRSAEDECDSSERIGKKPKTTTSSAITSKERPAQSAVVVRKESTNEKYQTKNHHQETDMTVPSRCSASSGSLPQLPMIDEVRYWRDVDRFSFLA